MLQKKVIRILTGIEYLAHTNILFYRTKILKLKDLHEFLLLLYAFKNKDSFSYSNAPYSTRHANDPIIIPHRLTLSEHSLCYAAAKLWRKLPDHLISIQTYGTFKCSLKTYFINAYGNT